MKIIHCADFHLDSAMTSNLDEALAIQRRNELLLSFVRITDYAQANDVSIILISGDLFDKRNISAITRETVMQCIVSHPHIHFYYLKGNHDENSSFCGAKESMPENLYCFDNVWRSYEEGNGTVTISGVEPSGVDPTKLYENIPNITNGFHIVMLHGQESESGMKSGIVNLKALRYHHIRYLALGHIHYYKRESLDGYGIYCYPGCPEGRGFDECGPHGFILLEIQDGCFTDRFIPFSRRSLFSLTVEVSNCTDHQNILQRARDAALCAGCTQSDLVRFILNGIREIEFTLNLDYLRSSLADEFYYVDVIDRTKLLIDPEEYASDMSLKGEFVRLILADTTLSDEEQKAVIRYGLSALIGEEI